MDFQPNFLKDLFHPKNLVFEIDNQSKREVISILVNQINENYQITETPEKWVNEFMKRERKGSTGLQNGIAIPHIKIENLDRFYLAIGLHHQGIDFKSIDGSLTHIIFLLIVPLSEFQFHLRFLSMMSRLFLQKNFKKRILQAKTPESVCDVFSEVFDE